jgi:Domain of unknown function (DUF1772)
MFSQIVFFGSLLSAALLVGSMFGVWLVFNPAGLDFGLYTTLQQQSIRTLNTKMPVLGGVTILLTLTAAVLARLDAARLGLLLAALIFFVTAGLITRFLNQPINAVVMTWKAASPASGWEGLRDSWWRWHLLRLAVGLGGLSFLIAATLRRG